jgi:hypothetical protein
MRSFGKTDVLIVEGGSGESSKSAGWSIRETVNRKTEYIRPPFFAPDGLAQPNRALP